MKHNPKTVEGGGGKMSVEAWEFQRHFYAHSYRGVTYNTEVIPADDYCVAYVALLDKEFESEAAAEDAIDAYLKREK